MDSRSFPMSEPFSRPVPWEAATALFFSMTSC